MTIYAAQQLHENFQDKVHEDLPEPIGADRTGTDKFGAACNRTDDIPTLKSVVLSGDETVIHSARLRHNLDNLTSALAAQSLSLQDENIEPEFICENNLKALLDKVIDTHVSRMRAEILAILEVHGARTGKSQD